MAEISSALIKDLREKTGAGMMDCKKALAENGGSMDAAVDWLRKKGLASAAKKSGRVAAEGLVGVAASGTKAAVIELNSETDFVARNEQFQGLAEAIAKLAIDNGTSIDKLKATSNPASKKTVQESVTEAIATIGENINLRRSAVLSVSKGLVATYVHSAVKPGLGKIGVLVGLESEADTSKLEALGKQLAMHIAAARPEALNRDGVDTKALERERNVLKEQAAGSGKPAEVVEKMVEGRIRKYYEEVVLLEQLFVVDGKTKVSDVVAAAEKEAGKPIAVTGFVRFQIGEGIEKEESDFAAEVAKAANG